MSKAILIMDMPECCNDCQLCYYSDGRVPICSYTRWAVDNLKAKPEWCILKLMPVEKFTCLNYDNETILNYNRGWNDCLKTIKRK